MEDISPKNSGDAQFQKLLRETESEFKSLPQDEQDVFHQILEAIKNPKLVSNPDFIASLKGKRRSIDKILNLKGFDDFLSPLYRHLLLSIDPEQHCIDLLRSIDQIDKNAKPYLDVLVALSNRGYMSRLRELIFIAHESTRRLEEMAHKYPSYLSLVARDHATWPILAANKKSKLSKKIEMLELIGLGKGLPNVTKAKKVAINPTPPQKWAVLLLKTIDSARQLKIAINESSAPKITETKQQRMTAKESFQFGVIDFTDNSVLLTSNELVNFAIKMHSLPEFSKKSVRAWWVIAHKMFLQKTNNEPWNIPELKTYANSQKVDPRAKGRKFDGIMRDNVVKAIRKAFFDLAKDTK